MPQVHSPTAVVHEPRSTRTTVVVSAGGVSDAAAAARWIYPATACVSAVLLFGLQPIVARAVVPSLGGSPAVWTTCVLFFQTALLAAYLYAHLLSRVSRLATQAAVHI